jgi:cell fate regulator YaaT (PSP1 superfamily)
MNNAAKNAVLQEPPPPPPAPRASAKETKIYRVKFRQGRKPHAAVCKIANLVDGELVMVQTDHGLEPAVIFGFSISFPELARKRLANIVRRANREEIDKYANWTKREEDAFAFCAGKIAELGLPMKLVRVERYFNGKNIVFYFTADNRVDFRSLVKGLVEEFRTRVEMRQVGVRHETKMIGGIGCCGRELCCSSFMHKFMPVSIKMVKEQELPLNPTKISGVCNRLLCCLTHEFSNYKTCRRGMPRLGRIVELDGCQYKVVQHQILAETIKLAAVNDRDDTLSLGRAEWGRLKAVAPGSKLPQRKSGGRPHDKRAGGPQAGLPAAEDKKASSAARSRRPRLKRTRRSRKVKK